MITPRLRERFEDKFMAEAIEITSDEQWHELRRAHIGGSECSALFNENPYMTRWELWQRKAGALPEPDLSDNPRVFWGRHLEPSIMTGVASMTGWNISKVHCYYSCLPGLGQGASIDAEITGHERGDAILEIKNTDWLVARQWTDGEPPLAFQLQAQHYLGVTGRAWAAIAVLVGGWDLRLFTFERRPQTIALIEREIAAFWASIAENKPPPADYMVDADTVMQLNRSVAAGKTVDLTGNNRLPELCEEYQRAAAAKGVEDKARKAAQAEILTIIGDAEIVICGDLKLKASEVRGTPDRIISQADVGTIIKGRAGYRGLHVSRRKERAA